MAYLKYIQLPKFTTENGKTSTISLSYQTFGRTIGEAPIVLINHALTANSNIIGPLGWWNDLVGENKCVDTDKYTVIAFNVPGNGFDKKAENVIYNYKDYTARDIAKIFLIGLRQLKITKLFAIIGGSTGGGIAWEMAALKPNITKHLIPIASDWKSTDWIIANCFIQNAILHNSKKPLYDARLHAMTLYRTPESFTDKFNRNKENEFTHSVESWLDFHGSALAKRFQVAAYKLMNQLLKTVNITRGRGSFLEVAQTIEASIHIITIKSDLFFKPEENYKTYNQLVSINKNVTIREIDSIHGHDAFLIEFDQLFNMLKPIFSPEKKVLKEENYYLKQCL